MGKINTIEDLIRNNLDTIESLQAGKIDVQEAGVTGKLYETVISAVKAQLQYSELNGTSPHLDFMGDQKNIKQLKTVTKETKRLTRR